MEHTRALEIRVARLEEKIKELEKILEFEYLTPEEEKELKKRMENPEFLSEEELRRELSVD